MVKLVNHRTELLNQTPVTKALSCCIVPLKHGRVTMAREGTSVWKNAWFLTSQFPFHPSYRGSKHRDMQSFPLGRRFECWFSLLVCFHECFWSVVDEIGHGRSHNLFPVCNSSVLCYWPSRTGLTAGGVVKQIIVTAGNLKSLQVVLWGLPVVLQVVRCGLIVVVQVVLCGVPVVLQVVLCGLPVVLHITSRPLSLLLLVNIVYLFIKFDQYFTF
jgi:hypothetical protein